MIKKKRAYKPTKNVTIRGVQKPYANMYKFLLGSKYGPRSENGQQTPSEAFNDMVMIVADDYLGEKEAREYLQYLKDTEHRLEKYDLRTNTPD